MKSYKAALWFTSHGTLIWRASMITAILVYMVWWYIDDGRKDEFLKIHGKTVYARMIGHHMSQSRLSTNVDDFVYQLNNITYRAAIDDYQQHYQIGDTVILRCSPNDNSIYNFIGARVNGKDYKRAGE